MKTELTSCYSQTKSWLKKKNFDIAKDSPVMCIVSDRRNPSSFFSSSQFRAFSLDYALLSKAGTCTWISDNWCNSHSIFCTILWKYTMDQVKTRSKVKTAVQDISFYISSNVTVISFVLLLSQIYFIFLINVPSLLLGYTCVLDTIIIQIILSVDSRGWSLDLQRSLLVSYSIQFLNNWNCDSKVASELTAILKLNLSDCIYDCKSYIM